MNKNRTKKSRVGDFIELLSLIGICLFVSTLLFGEIKAQKKCIPDSISQVEGSCQ